MSDSTINTTQSYIEPLKHLMMCGSIIGSFTEGYDIIAKELESIQQNDPEIMISYLEEIRSYAEYVVNTCNTLIDIKKGV